ncbi:metallophosphoesterase family protein [Bacillus sp. PS06]|uniref:metallophosphoesterase family protein n=1 Tax=Bacillus sp. PS06 TaxID=2764176 RepID=UPI00177AFFBD|nr:DNA repair exonuclease [Bacillus sp. PS06]MBD8067730.1 DNA repair exonuclease [Bacillus sp. PS06]
MNSITFLHIADVHLDSPFAGLKKLPESIYRRVRESTFQSFKRLMAIAIKEKVDFVIIAGDIFDQANRSIRAQTLFRKELERLNNHHIHVYIVHGNHDHIGAVWHDMSWPENVHTFSSQTVEVKTFKKGTSLVQLYGFSYPKRAVTENMTKYYQKEGTADYHIGILHGSVEGNEGHNQYAPFRVEQLLEKDFDYWALGHIHKSQILNEQPKIMYPGNVQGRHRKESGEKGGFVIRLTERETLTTFHPTADIIWETESVPINELTTLSELIDKLFQVINSARKDQEGVLLSLELTGHGPLHSILMDSSVIEDILSTLLEGEEENNAFVYVISLKVSSQLKRDREDMKNEASFVGDLLHLIDTYDQTKEALNSLYAHPTARRFLEELTVDEEQEIIQQAEEYLLYSLFKQPSNGGNT